MSAPIAGRVGRIVYRLGQISIAGLILGLAAEGALRAAPVPAAVAPASPVYSALYYSYGSGAGGGGSVVLTDLNGDGIADVAVTNSPDSTVSVLLGVGHGSFAGAKSYPAGAWPQFVTAGDLNGDGKADLVTADWGDSTVAVLLNAGDGTFGAPHRYSVGRYLSSPVIADLNGDGRSDLVVIYPRDSTVTLLFGDGHGAFQSRRDLVSGRGTTRVAVADVNGDGIPDLVVANRGAQSISVFLGRGDGTFAPRLDTAMTYEPMSIAVADINGDGKSDLAVGVLDLPDYGGSPSSLIVFLGHGDGTFGPGQSMHTGYDPESVAFTDLDGDGRLDLVSANTGVGTQDIPPPSCISIYKGNGDGTFGPEKEIASEMLPGGLAVGDVNGDGRPDLVTADGGDGDLVSVHLGNGDGTFGSLTYLATERQPGFESFVDVNGDGRADLVVASFAGISVYLGGGAMSSAARLQTPLPQRAARFVAGDLNGDGVPDLLVSGSNGAVYSLLGRGDGTFSVVNANISGSYDVAAVGDLHGDGRAVPVVASAAVIGSGRLYSTIYTFGSNGDGTFGSRQELFTGQAFASIVPADLNGDGRLDLVALDGIGKTIYVFLGRGDGSFGAPVAYSPGDWAYTLAVGDLDGDGKPDLVLAMNDSYEVLPGNGDGTFGARKYIRVSEPTTGMVLCDLNGDGKTDIAGLNEGYPGVTVLVNQGDGTFEKHSFGAGWHPYSLAVGDVDGDRVPDLAALDQGHDSVSVLLHLSAALPVPPGGHAASLRLAPSLSAGTLSLDLAHSSRGDVLVRIFDVQGREVARNTWPALPAGEQWERWEVRDAHGRALPNGGYWVRMETPAASNAARWTVLR